MIVCSRTLKFLNLKKSYKIQISSDFDDLKNLVHKNARAMQTTSHLICSNHMKNWISAPIYKEKCVFFLKLRGG